MYKPNMPAQRAGDQIFTPVWMKKKLVALIDQASDQLDLTRSQFIRTAVREKLEKMGIPLEEGVASAPSRKGRGGRKPRKRTPPPDINSTDTANPKE